LRLDAHVDAAAQRNCGRRAQLFERRFDIRVIVHVSVVNRPGAIGPEWMILTAGSVRKVALSQAAEGVIDFGFASGEEVERGRAQRRPDERGMHRHRGQPPRRQRFLDPCR
jgi:hypothetical protein